MDIKIPKAYKPGAEDIPNVIAPAGLEIASNYLKIGDYYSKTFLFSLIPDIFRPAGFRRS